MFYSGPSSYRILVYCEALPNTEEPMLCVFENGLPSAHSSLEQASSETGVSYHELIIHGRGPHSEEFASNLLGCDFIEVSLFNPVQGGTYLLVIDPLKSKANKRIFFTAKHSSAEIRIIVVEAIGEYEEVGCMIGVENPDDAKKLFNTLDHYN